MGNLLWGTLALGAAILLLLVAYNAWEIRRARMKRRALDVVAPGLDAGTDANPNASPNANTYAGAAPAETVAARSDVYASHDRRVEPTDDREAEPYEHRSVPVLEPTASNSIVKNDAERSAEHIFNDDILPVPYVVAASATLLPLPPLPPLAPLNDHVQAIASVDFAHATSGTAIQGALPGSLRAGSKPVEVRGYIADHGWVPLQGKGVYTRFAAGVLLANRAGALNEVEYSDFIALVQRVADGLGGEADFPDMMDAVKRARTLDEFAANHDALLTICLRARDSSWSAAYLQQAAAANGFSAGMVMGRMVHLSKDGTALLSLQFDPQAAMAEDPNAQALSSAKIVLDLPHVAEFQRPLSQLRHAATALALKLDADVTDEDGRPLGEATWGQLEAQMKGLYRELEAYGVAAGSVAALKLYS